MNIFICLLIVITIVNGQNEYRIHTNDAEGQHYRIDFPVTPQVALDGELYFIAHGKDTDPDSDTYDLIMYLLLKHIPETKETVVVLTLHQTPGEMATEDLTELSNIVMSGDNMYIFFSKIIYTYVPATGYFHQLTLVEEDADVVQGDIVNVVLERIETQNDLALADGLGGVYLQCLIHDYQYDYIRSGVQRTSYKHWYTLCKLEGGNGLETTLSSWYETYSDINATYAIHDLAIYNDEVVVSWVGVTDSLVITYVSVFSDGPLRTLRVSPGDGINQGVDIPVLFKIVNNDLYFFRFYSVNNKGIINTVKYSGTTTSTIDLQSIIPKDIPTGYNWTAANGYLSSSNVEITSIGDTIFFGSGNSLQLVMFQDGVYTELSSDTFSGFKIFNDEVYFASNWYEISKANVAGEVSVVHQSPSTAVVIDFQVIGGNVLVLYEDAGIPSVIFNNGESDVQISGSELNSGSIVAMLQYGRNILYSVPFQLYVKDYCGAIIERSHSWSSGLGELIFSQTRCDVTHSITIEFLNVREEFASGPVKKRHGDGWRGDRHDDHDGWRGDRHDDDEEDRHNNDRDWSENHGRDDDDLEDCDDDNEEGRRHREGHRVHDNHGRRHGRRGDRNDDDENNNCAVSHETTISESQDIENTQESNQDEVSEYGEESNPEVDIATSQTEDEDIESIPDVDIATSQTEEDEDIDSIPEVDIGTSQTEEEGIESIPEVDIVTSQTEEDEDIESIPEVDIVTSQVEDEEEDVRVTTVDVVTSGEGSVIDGSDVVIDSKTSISGDIRPIDSDPLGFSLNAYQLDTATSVDVDGVSVVFPEGTLLVEFSVSGLTPESSVLVDLGLTSTFTNALTGDTHTVLFSPETETCTMSPTSDLLTGTITPDECTFASGDYGETYPVRLIVKADAEGNAHYRYWSMTLPTLDETRFLSTDNLEQEKNSLNDTSTAGSTTLIILLIIAAVAGLVFASYQFSKSELSKIFD